MTDKLKPCPFCGGKAGIVEAQSEFFASCRNTHCPSFDTFEKEAEAVKVWNTRITKTDDNISKCELSNTDDSEMPDEIWARTDINDTCGDWITGPVGDIFKTKYTRATVGDKEPLKVLVDNEWLRKKIDSSPDLDTDCGRLHYEAPAQAGDVGEAFRAMERLANTKMEISLNGWQEISTPILAALQSRADLVGVCDIIKPVIRGYLLTNMQDELGEGYPLVDAMSTPSKTIRSGEDQIDLLVDEIYTELKAKLGGE